jgi:DNA-binding transcriptional ArsR family regulator
MVNYPDPSLNAVFAALADPTRRAILARLAQRESTVSQLAEPFSISLPAVGKHLRVLEQAGLVKTEKEGRIRYCRLEPKPLHEATAWLEHYRSFWEKRLEALELHLLAKRKRTNRRKEKKVHA